MVLCHQGVTDFCEAAMLRSMSNNTDFNPSTASPNEYRERIRLVEAELDWLKQGYRLFASGRRGLPQPASEMDKPVLRKAILRVMGEGTKDIWKVPELIDTLTERGWMPNGTSAKQIVRSRVSSMATAGELERVSYGAYKIPSSPSDEGGLAGNS
jgi:hypothetical protein